MYRFQFKAYRRSFAGVFSNAREGFARREGLLIRLEDADGRVGFGEAAPIPSFGSESFVSAVAAASALPERLRLDEVGRDLAAYPALWWGIESALDRLLREGRWAVLEKPWAVCGLLPGQGDEAAAGEAMAQLGYRCLKLKIGKRPFLEERRLAQSIVESTNGRTALRLDANGSLSRRDAVQWLESVQDLPVEFIEQPLPLGEEDTMLRLSADFPTPLALDESVCRVDDLKRWRDAQWPGVFVLKPSLSGGLGAMREELGEGVCDCVYSSALETRVGAANALALAVEFPGKGRALGFGVDALFADRKLGLNLGSFLQSEDFPSTDALQLLWNQI